MTDRTGVSSGGAAGMVMTWSALAADELVALGRNRDDDAAARLDLLHLADHLVVDIVLRRDGHHRHVSSIRAMGPCFISPAG